MIAIHHNPGSASDRWVAQCKERDIPFISIDLFDNLLIDILKESQVKGLLFWITDHMAPKTRLAARAICHCVELAGIRVFPNSSSYWHCDDKIAQHYLFNALNLPRCNTYVFYSEQEALDWADDAEFPKVFKLRCGAGSTNVRLIRNRAEAGKRISVMFRRGQKAVTGLFSDLSTKAYKHSKELNWMEVLKRAPQTIRNLVIAKTTTPKERGYIYFQDFLAGNDYDTRVTVIGQRAFAFRRFVRPGDFRASGSGRLDTQQKDINPKCIEHAFRAAEAIKSQCMAFDFVFTPDGSPIILEGCYAFMPEAVKNCPGYWTRDLQFVDGAYWPQDVILDDFMQEISMRAHSHCDEDLIDDAKF